MTPTEEKISSVWCEVLGIEHIAVTADYLEIGFDSVQALRALARLSDVVGYRVPVRTFFRMKTIEELGAAIDAEIAAGDARDLESALALVEALDPATLDPALDEPANRNSR